MKKKKKKTSRDKNDIEVSYLVVRIRKGIKKKERKMV